MTDNTKKALEAIKILNAMEVRSLLFMLDSECHVKVTVRIGVEK